VYSGGAAPTYCVQVSAALGPPAHADIGLLISWQDMICNCLRSSISTYHAMELVWIALPARMEFGAVLSQQRLPVILSADAGARALAGVHEDRRGARLWRNFR